MIAVTAATGQLGRLVVRHLLDRGHSADELVAGVRDPARAVDLAALGVVVREADYDRPETLGPAFADVDRLLFVSGSEVGQRGRQHANVVGAAAAAGVSHVVYTSVLGGLDTTLVLAPEHQETESLIETAAFPATTMLRNGWYTENYAPAVHRAAASGVVLGSAGAGRVSSAARNDYAEAAAVVLLDAGREGPHAGRAYELSGDVAWSFPELAAAIGEAAGREVAYRDVPTDEHVAALREAGTDEQTAGFLARLDTDIHDGLLDATPGDLARLIGRPTTPMPQTVAAILADDA